MRDVLFLPLSETEELVIAADCSGGIGLKEADIVKVPYETVSYYGARVALMEVMSVGADPIAVVLQNFVHDKAWNHLVEGIHRALKELHLSIPITGSSESNFLLLQSAASVTVIGKVNKKDKRIGITPQGAKFAVLGEPLVGDDVMRRQDRVLPLEMFHKLLKLPGIYELVPIGSKGILHELELLLKINGFESKKVFCPLPMHVSSGPATSILISYQQDTEDMMKEIVEKYFFPINFIEF
jgi:hypothetical protein